MDDKALAVREIIAEVLRRDVEDIQPQTDLVSDVGMDSMDAVEVACEVEDRFGIKIDDEVLKKIRTVQDVIDLAPHAMGSQDDAGAVD